MATQPADMESGLLAGLSPLADAPVTPPHVIAAVALNMAIRWHDSTLVKDGAMYQQLKLEGRNIPCIAFDDVLETASRLEAWLIGADERIAGIMVKMIDQLGEEADASADDGISA